jgi:hypothetical protein
MRKPPIAMRPGSRRASCARDILEGLTCQAGWCRRHGCRRRTGVAPSDSLPRLVWFPGTRASLRAWRRPRVHVIDINSKVWPVRISTQRVEEASRPSLLGPWRRSSMGPAGRRHCAAVSLNHAFTSLTNSNSTGDGWSSRVVQRTKKADLQPRQQHIPAGDL